MLYCHSILPLSLSSFNQPHPATVARLPEKSDGCFPLGSGKQAGAAEEDQNISVDNFNKATSLALLPQRYSGCWMTNSIPISWALGVSWLVRSYSPTVALIYDGLNASFVPLKF